MLAFGDMDASLVLTNRGDYMKWEGEYIKVERDAEKFPIAHVKQISFNGRSAFVICNPDDPGAARFVIDPAAAI